MNKSVYIVGGAGTGKSTFTGQLLHCIGEELGPLQDLHSKPNSRGTMITLRGHRIGGDGLYLGCMRDSFPGTDGLDRVSYIPGEEWLELGHHKEFGFVVGEGATLAVRRFITKMHEHTDLLLVHLAAEDFVKELRFLERGSNQDPKFVLATETRSRNLLEDMAKAGVACWDVDTADPAEWQQALDVTLNHLQSG